MSQKHSIVRDGKRLIWHTERLWELAQDLQVFEKGIDEFPEIDRDCWFGVRHAPTIRNVLEHCRRIAEADLSYPVILNADGSLMDGGHRIAKAMSMGLMHVKAVQFASMPEPDEILMHIVTD